MALQELPIDPWWCPDRLREDNFVFYLVIKIRFVYELCLIWNSNPSRV